MFVSLPCFADDKPPCTGDQTACDILQISQRGTDPASGAHVVAVGSTRLRATVVRAFALIPHA
jgi:hypothetical protein